MSPIKDFKLTYEALNKEGSFSEGDTIAGIVTFTLTEETKVKGIVVKVKGEARVHWTEGTGDRRRSHSDHRRYFKEKQNIVEENTGAVLPHGVNRFNFKIKIPPGNMPSSFKGYHGNITYILVAKISRSWRVPSTTQKELNFVTKSFPHLGQFMLPNSNSVSKEVGVFSKAQIQLSASLDKTVCCPGDTLTITGTLCYSSSKDTALKFSLQKKTVYRAYSSSTISDESLSKAVGETIKGNSEETFSFQMLIPPDAHPTIHNCEIIYVDYYIKVYLDIRFAVDPEVKLPVIIIPSPSHQSGQAVGPYSDFAPSGFPAGPYPIATPPGAYGYPAPTPTNTSGYNNQWPQQGTPYGFSAAAYPPSLVQNQTPTAPPVFQQELPPSYNSLYPSIHGNYSSTGSDEKKFPEEQK